MPDRRNPHNSYYYKPLDQAAPIYVPPSHSTQHILPVPQQEGQTEYHYGRPGEAKPFYIPGSDEIRKAKGQHMSQNMSGGGNGPYGYAALPPQIQNQPMRPMQPMPQQAPPPRDSGGGIMGMAKGMMGGGGAAMGLSDRHSKEEIQRLTAKNDALTKAFTGNRPASFSNVGTDGLTDERRKYYSEQEQHAHGTGRPPMSTDLARWSSSFGGAEPADRVAAQNVGIQATSGAQHSPTGMPPTQEQPRGGGEIPTPQGPPGPTYAGPMPDLTALDEAYRRQSQGG